MKGIISSSMEDALIVNHFNASETAVYKDVKWLGYSTDTLKDGYAYVGSASMLRCSFNACSAALVIVNDCGMDFSNCPLEVVEIANTVDSAELYLGIKKQIFKEPQCQCKTEEILYALLAEKSVPEIINFSCDFLQNPLIAFGCHANVLCFSSKYGTQEYIPAAMDMDADGIDRFKFHSKISDDYNFFLNTTLPVLFEDGYCFRGKSRIATTISLGSRYVGAVALFEVNRKLRDEDHVYLGIISKAISNKLAIQGIQRDFYGLQFEQNMIDLLNGNRIDSINNRWLSHINGHKYQNFTVAALNASGLTSRQFDDLKRFISLKLYFCSIVKHGKDVVVLANPRDEYEARALRNILSETIEQFSVEIGCSNISKNILDLRVYYTQAVNARELGCATGCKRDIHEFKKLKIYILLKEIASKVELAYYISPDCEVLNQYDFKHNTEYGKTLLSFIRCGKSRQKTCELLNIHKNTLAYRLDRIAELLGCSLDDGDFLFDIYLSALIKKSLK